MTRSKQKPNRPAPPPEPRKKPVAAKTPAAKPKAAPPPSPAGRSYGWVGLLAAALGMILYANTVGHDYCLDDYSAIKDNWVVKGGLKNLGTIFTTEYRYGVWSSYGSLYRPFSLAMFALEWQLSPDNPAVGHFVNMALYGFTGWLLWITWRRILVDYPVALPALAVLLFIAHPVHTEVVANIKSRDEILAMIGGIGALYGLWRHFENRGAGWLVLALASYTLGLFSKESAITFLALIPLTVWFFGRRPTGELLRLTGLFLIPTAIFLLVRHQALSKQGGEEVFSILDNFIVGAANPAERLASALMMCGRYLWTLVFPHPLISDLGYPQMRPVGFGDWRALAGLVVYGGMFVWAILNLGRRHFLSFAILFYLISFSLFSNVLILIGTSYGERLLYLPSLGFAFATAWALLKIFRIDDPRSVWNPNGKGALVWGTAGVLLAMYSLKTISRNPAWDDSYSLYSADLPNSPNCAKLHYHIGLEETKRGLNKAEDAVADRKWIEKGLASYSKAIELYPGYHDAYGSRGLAYFRLQEYDKAFTDYQEAIKHRPNDAKVLSNMGYIYFMRQQLDKAEEVYRKAVQYDPRFVDARRNLGAVLAMKKQFPAAIEQWQEALKYDPNNKTLLEYIGFAYRDMGQPEQARPWLERAQQAGANPMPAPAQQAPDPPN
jgi:tetratricopeptide (TPR) repeat protein